MAVRKLPLPLFSAKTPFSQPGCSKSYLHFVAAVRQRTHQYALVCESQSRITRRDRVYLRPKRRPERPAQAF
jgi:hypothetical protein